jgi:hypothetical protein
MGVTSIVRALNLRPELYHALLRLFHSTAVKLDRLTALWATPCCCCSQTSCVSTVGLFWVGDGVKIPVRMPCRERTRHEFDHGRRQRSMTDRKEVKA